MYFDRVELDNVPAGFIPAMSKIEIVNFLKSQLGDMGATVTQTKTQLLTRVRTVRRQRPTLSVSLPRLSSFAWYLMSTKLVQKGLRSNRIAPARATVTDITSPNPRHVLERGVVHVQFNNGRRQKLVPYMGPNGPRLQATRAALAPWYVANVPASRSASPARSVSPARSASPARSPSPNRRPVRGMGLMTAFPTMHAPNWNAAVTMANTLPNGNTANRTAARNAASTLSSLRRRRR